MESGSEACKFPGSAVLHAVNTVVLYSKYIFLLAVAVLVHGGVWPVQGGRGSAGLRSRPSLQLRRTASCSQREARY